MPGVKRLPALLDDLRAHPQDPGVLQNVIDDMMKWDDVPEETKAVLPRLRADAQSGDADRLREAYAWVREELEILLDVRAPLRRGLRVDIPPRQIDVEREGGRRTQSKKFSSCVKAVRKTVKVRKGSTSEGAAIAICTKSLLFPRGRTIKRYKKGRLYTQKRK